MKTCLSIALLFTFFCSNAQDSEFGVTDKGLIYSDAAMSKLKHIVDSLNLKFKVCELNKKYTSVKLAKAHYIDLSKSKVKDAKKDIDNNISFEDFVLKYPKAVISKNELITTSTYYESYYKSDMVSFNTIGYSRGYSHEISKMSEEVKPFLSSTIKGKWLYDYNEKTNYSDENIRIFYFVDNFSSKAIPGKYSKWIQYSDCLIDTTVTVFTDKAKESGVRYYEPGPNKCRDFNEYVENVLKKPSFELEKFDILVGMDTIDFERPNKKISKKKRIESNKKRAIIEKEFEVFQNKRDAWEEKRISRLDSLKNNDTTFMLKLMEAYAESKDKSNSDDQFEEYIGMYISKDAELEMKRNRRVIGGCSMDDSPRRHAFSIALLSAETTKWEIFLQSHLNIMNDRFDRVSDGSWAQQGRSTYIKELEDLDINVLDLLFGISLRVENPSQNHYYGSISRLGRALAESKNKNEFETTALNMIEDNELDDYNRILIYFLYDNYNHNLVDKTVAAKNTERLKLSVSKLPDYIISKIEIKQ